MYGISCTRQCKLVWDQCCVRATFVKMDYDYLTAHCFITPNRLTKLPHKDENSTFEHVRMPVSQSTKQESYYYKICYAEV